MHILLEKSKQVLSHAAVLVAGSGLSQALMALSALLLARFLGPAEYGIYAAHFSTVGLTSILFNLGLDSWLHWRAAQNPWQTSDLFLNALYLKTLALIPWVGGLVLILPQVRPEIYSWQIVLICAEAVWLEGIFNLGLSVFRARLQNWIAAFLLVVLRGGFLLLVLGLLAVHRQEAVVYASARLGVACVSVLCVLVILSFNFRWSSWARLFAIFRESLVFAVSDLFTSIYVQADVSIVALILNKELVGFYSSASSIINALFVIPLAGYYVAVVYLVRLLKIKSPIMLKHYYLLVLIGFAIIGLLLWLGVWGVSGILPTLLLGSAFSQLSPILIVLSPIVFFKSCNYGAAAILVAAGWQNRRMYVQAFSALVNIVLNILLIKQLGIMGVAGVYVVSELVLFLGYWGLVIRCGWGHARQEA